MRRQTAGLQCQYRSGSRDSRWPAASVARASEAVVGVVEAAPARRLRGRPESPAAAPRLLAGGTRGSRQDQGVAAVAGGCRHQLAFDPGPSIVVPRRAVGACGSSSGRPGVRRPLAPVSQRLSCLPGRRARRVADPRVRGTFREIFVGATDTAGWAAGECLGLWLRQQRPDKQEIE